ncbi:MAG: hypothetical protein HXS44_04490 [Theionarchaea archaeon]|nr:hypothetical protein [Theionarchaea archaeon]
MLISFAAQIKVLLTKKYLRNHAESLLSGDPMLNFPQQSRSGISTVGKALYPTSQAPQSERT